ncbi:MAG: hypothetical protein ACFFCS_28060 [Candidatus Hodarchaeota archaeon]
MATCKKCGKEITEDEDSELLNMCPKCCRKEFDKKIYALLSFFGVLIGTSFYSIVFSDAGIERLFTWLFVMISYCIAIIVTFIPKIHSRKK